MKEIQFKDLNINDKFTLNGTEYIRIPDKKVSCCKILNAIEAAKPEKSLQIKPNTVLVQIND